MSLRRDTAWNLAGSFVPLVAAVVTIPYVLETLGNEAFGILALIWALVGYFGVFDLGAGRALTYEVSRRVHGSDSTGIGQLVTTGLVLTGATGLLGAVLVYYLIAPFAGTWFKVSPDLAQIVRSVFEITAFSILPTAITSGVRGALEGFRRFPEANLNRGAIGTLMFLIPAATILMWQGDLRMIAVNLVAARIAVCVMGIVQLRQHIFVGVPLRLKEIRLLLNYGIWATIGGMISPLMVYGDRYLVAYVLGAHVLPLYAIPQEALQRILIIPAALTGALMPRLTAAWAKGSDVTIMYRTNLRRIAIIMLGVFAVAAALAHPVLVIWISADFADHAIIIVWILCFGLWINSIAQMPYMLLHAIGRPKTVALFQIAELVVYAGLIYGLSKSFGIVGAALAWTLRVSGDCVLLHLAARPNVAGRHR